MNNLKKSIPALILMIISIMLLGSCDLLSLLTGKPAETVTAAERIGLFIEELNLTDRSGIYLHFHPDTLSRQQIADEVVFSSGPLSETYTPFSFDQSASSTLSSGQEKVSGNLENANGKFPFFFIMEKSGSDWFIRELELTANDESYIIKKIDF